VLVFGYKADSGHRSIGLGLSGMLPAAAASFVRGLHTPGHIYNQHGYGAYLAWAWDGNPQLMYHGYVHQPEFYTNEYLGVDRGPAEFDRIVKKYDIDVFFLRRQPVQLTKAGFNGSFSQRALLTRPEWHLVYWDNAAVVFLRDRPETHALIAKYEYRYLNPYLPDVRSEAYKKNPQGVRAEAARVLQFAPDTVLPFVDKSRPSVNAR
jgi:hypothetical protein